jgi:4-hydroxybenzoate polyprenyltransferase
MSRLRTILTLSRASRLPTVWSNCLAGWWLGGGGNAENLPFLFAGATLLYLGAAFLNDAFDAEYDAQHKRLRPIPAGAVGQDAVWRSGLAWLVAGSLVLLWPGRVTGGFGLTLAFLIILYNTVHRLVRFSPVLKGICRCFLYVLGASVAEHGITGAALWCGLALGAYVTGLRCFARWEQTPRRAKSWPVLLLAAPVFLALIMNAGRYREPTLLLSALLVLWELKALRQTFWSSERNVPRTVADLLAGIVFVDWLATCPVASVFDSGYHAPRELSFAFIGLLLGTLLLQKLLPEP